MARGAPLSHRARSGRSRTAPSRNTWLQLGAGPVGLDVHHHPHAALEGAVDVQLLGAEEGHVVEAGGARRGGREGAVQVGGGGEDHADHVVGAETVALEEGGEQRLHPHVHLLAGVLVEGGGAPQGSHGHRRAY